MTTEAQELIPSPLRENAAIQRGLAMDATSFDHGISVFSSGVAFQLGTRMAEHLAHSSFLPESYRGNVGDCLVLIDYASRLRVPVVQLAQNMDVVKGRPGLRGTFLAGIINASPLFSRLKYEWRGSPTGGKNGAPTDDYGCRAYATEVDTGDVLEGTWVDWAMVTGEKWDVNTKWRTMREQMFMYRAASFWSRAHASDITLGLYESEELHDITPAPQRLSITRSGPSHLDDFARRLEQRAAEQQTVDVDQAEAAATEPEPSPDPDAERADPPPQAEPASGSTPSRRRRGTIE